jgi:hypothetical protein
VRQKGGFVACFPLNVLMVHSTKLTFIANSNNLTDVGLALGETICFGSLEFTVDHFSNLSLSLEGNDSCFIFVGMVHNGSLSLHTILEDSSDEGDMTSGGGRGGALAPCPSRMQCGDPDCPHSRHTTTGGYSGASDHSDSLVADHLTATRYQTPS